MSKPATAEYSYSGNQSAPELNYYWNTFDGSMSIQVANLGTYEFEAYPDKVDITFTHTENSADVVALTMENVTPDNNQLDTDALTKGATYDVTAVATSNSEYVLNPTSDTTTVATGLLLGDSGLITDAYSYSDGFANNIFAWPRAYDGFDLENGGTAGYAPAMGGGKTEFVATPVSSGDGSYTYDLAAGNWTRSGKLELKADGTFTAELEGSGPVNSSEYGGSWVDNGDGTATHQLRSQPACCQVIRKKMYKAIPHNSELRSAPCFDGCGPRNCAVLCFVRTGKDLCYATQGIDHNR